MMFGAIGVDDEGLTNAEWDELTPLTTPHCVSISRRRARRWPRWRAGARLPLRQKLRARCNAAIAARLTLGAAQQLFNMSGGRTLYQSNALQRLMRDMLAAASHFRLDWNIAAANYGRDLLGIAD
jgi:hypothetical protein